MTDETRGCSRCEGLVVMVAVACSQCGEIHHSGHVAPPGNPGSRSTNETRPVFDVPAVMAETPPPGAPAASVLPMPVLLSDLAHRSAPSRMRMSATYTNGGGSKLPTPHTPRALPRGRPAPAPLPPRQDPSPDLPRAVHREPKPPRRPLVQLIQEVLNRSATRDLEPGTCVVVRNRFNGRWTPGFEVHEVLEAGYRIRRDHGAVLPTVFLRSDVAAAKSGSGGDAKLHGRASACASI